MPWIDRNTSWPLTQTTVGYVFRCMNIQSVRLSRPALHAIDLSTPEYRPKTDVQTEQTLVNEHLLFYAVRFI